MSDTFLEINSEDVQCAVRKHFNKTIRDEKAEEVFDQLNLQAITKSASYGEILDDQLNYAYNEIALQIKVHNIDI